MRDLDAGERQAHSSGWNGPVRAQLRTFPVCVYCAPRSANSLQKGVDDGSSGALVGMGIPEYEAKRYEGRVKEGGVLVSVHCDSSEEVSRAKELLERAGGEDVASAGEKSVSSHTVGRDRDTVDSNRNVDSGHRRARDNQGLGN